jgi:hypothetical protein
MALLVEFSCASIASRFSNTSAANPGVGVVDVARQPTRQHPIPGPALARARAVCGLSSHFAGFDSAPAATKRFTYADSADVDCYQTFVRKRSGVATEGTLAYSKTR